MRFIRSHIFAVSRFTTASFVLSWLLMAIVLPAKIVSIADSHSIYSIFNVDEGCFELVVDHQKEAEDRYLMDENNDSHSFQNSCCFGDLALTFKKQEVNEKLPLTYLKAQDECNLFSELFVNSENPQKKPFPPPVSFQELRITRLLI